LSDDFEPVGTLAQVWEAGLAELSFNPFGLGALQTVTKTRVVFVNKSQRCKSHTEGPLLVADARQSSNVKDLIPELGIDDDDRGRQGTRLVEGRLIVGQPIAGSNPNRPVLIQEECVAVRVVPDETFRLRYVQYLFFTDHVDSRVGSHPDLAGAVVAKKKNFVAVETRVHRVMFELQTLPRELHTSDTEASPIANPD